MYKLYIITETGTEAEPKVGMNPLGLRTINNEVKIERLIKQAKEAGINEIYVEVAYRKELYFYLEEKYDIELVDNQRRDLRGMYSLYCISKNLSDAYVVSSNEYFENNPFIEKRKISYYVNDENTGFRDLIFISDYSSKLLKNILESGNINSGIYFNEIRDYVIKHAINLNFTEKIIKSNDNDYLENNFFLEEINKNTYRKIEEVLNCKAEDIKNVQLVTAGNSNSSFSFEVRGNKYIYRQPGLSSRAVVDRKSEIISQKIAEKLGLDDTALYIDETGIKISKFVENIVPFEYKNKEHRRLMFEKLRTLHDSGLKNKYDFDVLAEADRLFTLAAEKRGDILGRFDEVRNQVHKLFEYTQKDNYETVLSHSDMHAGNFMISDDGENKRLYLIDWEFSKNSDPAYDFGCMVSYEDFTESQVNTLLWEYFNRKPTAKEERHFKAYIAISGWYFMAWCQYKESQGEVPWFNMVNRYHNVKKYLSKILPLYENA
ncbi:CTP:phosphocholine cytidylyltransferase [Acetitomaculum ruminis DSM 5522]|uniref:CTP:phosphocholine cytidylyltransferase n=1 Tax=Acetitomaculum ruminis DSM 5522 TaxID=1120918 RepID=A0A1I1A6B7_9FIRM|nr:phosphotransferase [Acetitomaculum ruminis]SFB31953.1 CTP:phosphocholine cytidylyltransferase [Acetitomaculum ruminis DSM 5522]